MASTLKLYDFQQDCVRELLGGKHIIYATVGTGKTGIGAVWVNEVCKHTGKKKVLVISTASKVKTCFPCGQKVMTATGEKPIEEVVVGEEVFSYENGKVILNKVTKVFKKETQAPLMRLDFGSGCNIIATSDHPFYVGNGKYAELQTLKQGDSIYGLASKTSRSTEETRKGNGSFLPSVSASSMSYLRESNPNPDESTTRQFLARGKINVFDGMFSRSQTVCKRKSLQKEVQKYVPVGGTLQDMRDENGVRRFEKIAEDSSLLGDTKSRNAS